MAPQSIDRYKINIEERLILIIAKYLNSAFLYYSNGLLACNPCSFWYLSQIHKTPATLSPGGSTLSSVVPLYTARWQYCQFMGHLDKLLFIDRGRGYNKVNPNKLWGIILMEVFL